MEIIISALTAKEDVRALLGSVQFHKCTTHSWDISASASADALMNNK